MKLNVRDATAIPADQPQATSKPATDARALIAKATEHDREDHGPAMSELNERQRLFVIGVCDGLSYSEAARQAGYAGEPQTIASTANRLLRSQPIIEAIAEVTKKHIRSLAPKAKAVVTEIMDDKYHKDRLKAAQQVLDRIDPAVQRQDINVRHEVIDRTEETLKHLSHLLEIGVQREALVKEFGEFGLDHYMRLLEARKAASAKVIDAEFVEIKND